MEMVLEYLLGMSEGIAGKDARKYFPWVVTIFLFVIISNWSGLIPGVGSIGMYQSPEGHTEDVQHEEAPAGEDVPAEEEAPADDGHGFLLDGQLAMADGNLILTESSAIEAAPAAAEERSRKICSLLPGAERRPERHLCAGAGHDDYGAGFWCAGIGHRILREVLCLERSQYLS